MLKTLELLYCRYFRVEYDAWELRDIITGLIITMTEYLRGKITIQLTAVMGLLISVSEAYMPVKMMFSGSWSGPFYN